MSGDTNISQYKWRKKPDNFSYINICLNKNLQCKPSKIDIN